MFSCQFYEKWVSEKDRKNSNRGGGGGVGGWVGGGSGSAKGDQEKTTWNFQRYLFKALEFPRDLTQFSGISKG